MLWGLFWISIEYYGWGIPLGRSQGPLLPPHSTSGSLPVPGEAPSFHPAARTTYLRVSDNTFGFQLNCVCFVFFFSCFSENLAIDSVSKKVQSNHLDHILDPPKTVKSRTKSFWFPPLRGKRSTPFWWRNATLTGRLVSPAGAKQQHTRATQKQGRPLGENAGPRCQKRFS